MDFEQLKTFLEVARQKSFSRAAERLLVTQPAISAQIRSLEKETGARLFDRDGGRVTFTAAGRVFEPFAEHCLNCHSHILGIIAELYGHLEELFRSAQMRPRVSMFCRRCSLSSANSFYELDSALFARRDLERWKPYSTGKLILALSPCR